LAFYAKANHCQQQNGEATLVSFVPGYLFPFCSPFKSKGVLSACIAVMLKYIEQMLKSDLAKYLYVQVSLHLNC
jgi:hypothetical protein